MLKQFQESIHSRLVRFAAAVSQSVSQSLSQSVTPLAEWRFLLLILPPPFTSLITRGPLATSPKEVSLSYMDTPHI